MWEYKRSDIKFRQYAELIETLNTEGNEGWEVVHYDESLPEKFDNNFTARVLYKRNK